MQNLHTAQEAKFQTNMEKHTASIVGKAEWEDGYGFKLLETYIMTMRTTMKTLILQLKKRRPINDNYSHQSYIHQCKY